MKCGLVLGGGGTRGSYHIGAWQALRECGIEISGIVGTSIGAVNGALLAQGGEETAKQLWNHISLGDIVKLPDGINETENLFHIKNLTTIAKEITKQSGLDISPFETLLKKIINEDVIRSNEIDYGLVTFSLTEKSEHALFKEQIPVGQLADFVLASASMPGFQTKKIGDAVYVDGGVSNNIPVNMMVDRGYEDIIVIDVAGVGIARNQSFYAKNIIHVKCSSAAVGTMDFRPEAIAENTKMGYFETLKALGKTAGNLYSFRVSDYYEAREKYAAGLIEGLEEAAKILEMDKYQIYSIEHFVKKAAECYREEAKAHTEFDIKSVLSDKAKLCHLTRAMIEDNYEILNNKLLADLLGDVYEGASALAYFCKKFLL